MNFIKNSMLFLIAAFIFTSCVDENQINEVADQQNEFLLKVDDDFKERSYLSPDARTQITEQLAQNLQDGSNPFDVEVDESKIISIEEFEREFFSEDNIELSTRDCSVGLVGDIDIYTCVLPGFTPHVAVYHVHNADAEPRVFEYMLNINIGGNAIPYIPWDRITIAPGDTWSLGGTLLSGNYTLCMRDSECGGYIQDLLGIDIPTDRLPCP